MKAILSKTTIYIFAVLFVGLLPILGNIGTPMGQLNWQAVAQDCVQPDGTTPGVDVQIGTGSVELCPIRFPLFLSLDQAKNFSIYSYVALVVSLIFVFLIMFWIFKIIASAVAIVQSQGDSGKMAESIKNIQAIFIGLTTMFVFLGVFTIIGLFFNLGSIFEWPKKLSICKEGQFYVTKALELNTATEAEVDAACFK